jgi:hypothetical protein
MVKNALFKTLPAHSVCPSAASRLLWLPISILLYTCSTGWSQNRSNRENLQEFRRVSTGVELESSLGRNDYADHPFLGARSSSRGAVWKASFAFNSWYQITPRWSIGSNVGLHTKYFQLKTSATVEELSDEAGFPITTTDRSYGLRRIRYYTTALNLGLNSEYLFTPALSGPMQVGIFAGIGSGFALGTTVESRFYEIGRRNTIGDLVNVFNLLNPNRGLFTEEQLPEQIPIENYFEGRLNPAPFIYQAGFVLYSRLRFRTDFSPRFRFKIAYTGAMQPLSTGFLHPYRSISVSIGTRLYQKK